MVNGPRRLISSVRATTFCRHGEALDCLHKMGDEYSRVKRVCLDAACRCSAPAVNIVGRIASTVKRNVARWYSLQRRSASWRNGLFRRRSVGTRRRISESSFTHAKNARTLAAQRLAKAENAPRGGLTYPSPENNSFRLSMSNGDDELLDDILASTQGDTTSTLPSKMDDSILALQLVAASKRDIKAEQHDQEMTDSGEESLGEAEYDAGNAAVSGLNVEAVPRVGAKMKFYQIAFDHEDQPSRPGDVARRAKRVKAAHIQQQLRRSQRIAARGHNKQQRSSKGFEPVLVSEPGRQTRVPRTGSAGVPAATPSAAAKSWSRKATVLRTPTTKVKDAYRVQKHPATLRRRYHPALLELSPSARALTDEEYDLIYRALAEERELERKKQQDFLRAKEEKRLAEEKEKARIEAVEKARIEAERLRLEEEKKAEETRVKEERARKQGVRATPTEKVITAISPEWEQIITSAMQGPDGTQLAKLPNGLPLTRRDFSTLLPTARDRTGGWLNDEIINGYLNLVVDHRKKIDNPIDPEGGESTTSPKLQTQTQTQTPTPTPTPTPTKAPKPTPSIHAFNSYFYSNLSSRGTKSIARWTERVGMDGARLLSVEHVFIPVNQNKHWTLIVVSPTLRTIEYFDSLGGRPDPFVRNIKDWLRMELGDKYVDAEWKVLDTPSPKQNNGFDCGVFTVTTAKMIVLGYDPFGSYTQDDIVAQRMRMAAELISGGVWGEFAPA